MAKHPDQDYFLLISILDLRNWYPLSRTRKLDALWHNLTTEEELALRKAFGVFLARLTAETARRCIRYQQFPIKYKPLNEKYLAWKKSEGRKTGFWQSSEFLCNHIDAWWDKRMGEVKIGFRPRLKHPDNGQLVSEIARALEKGCPERNLPARPLFNPVARSIEKSIFRHFQKFLRTQPKRYWKFVEGMQ